MSLSETPTSYAESYCRLTKENLYMVMALWMERFPVEGEQEDLTSYKKVGAVLVLPNDMSYAVDCTRHGVHAVARLLMAHQSILEDCKVFVSRKPCSFCTKLLVQSKIKRVFYLPIEPEYKRQRKETETEEDVLKKFKTEGLRVDNLFKVSPIGQAVFVPKAGPDVLRDVEKKVETPQAIRDMIKTELMQTYWNEGWMQHAEENLPWPAFDANMKKQLHGDFEGMMTWMATILVGSEKGYKFTPKSRPNEDLPFDPERNDTERLQAQHLITLAKFLAERTDDPKTGVGAVIINKEKEIIGLGWNGFPKKALYGEFPRASKADQSEQKKYAYVIHAEQNALLLRNNKKIKGGIMFVTKTPCDQCTPLLEMQEIKTFVLGSEMKSGDESEPPHEEEISYKIFKEKVERGDFICFEMKSAGDFKGIPPAAKRQRKFLSQRKKATSYQHASSHVGAMFQFLTTLGTTVFRCR